jgi:hypothetical protein
MSPPSVLRTQSWLQQIQSTPTVQTCAREIQLAFGAFDLDHPLNFSTANFE